MKRSHEGTGLGLSIAKSMVEKMSGKIWVEQKTEPGARFVFTLLLPHSTEQSVHDGSLLTTNPELPPKQGGLQVLLVEDNPGDADLVRIYLEQVDNLAPGTLLPVVSVTDPMTVP